MAPYETCSQDSYKRHTKYFCDHLVFLFFYFRSTLITFLLNVHSGLFGNCGSKSEQILLSAQLLEMLSMTLSLKGDKIVFHIYNTRISWSWLWYSFHKDSIDPQGTISISISIFFFTISVASNSMQMSKNHCLSSFALNSTRQKCDVWTGPKLRHVSSRPCVAKQHLSLRKSPKLTKSWRLTCFNHSGLLQNGSVRGQPESRSRLCGRFLLLKSNAHTVLCKDRCSNSSNPITVKDTSIIISINC